MPTHDRVHDQIAAAFGLTAFTVSIGAGIAVGNPTALVLVRSVVVLPVAYTIGCVLGRAASMCLHEYLTQTVERNPVPDPVTIDATASSGAHGAEDSVDTP